MSNISEFRKAVKQASKTYGFVAYSDNDGIYLELKKVDILESFKGYPSDTEIVYRIDENNNLYIN